MDIAVIGAGAIGGTAGTSWAKVGHRVWFSSRHPERLAALVASAGANARAATVAEAAAQADVLLFAVYYETIDEALSAAGPLAGKILIDAINPYLREPNGGWRLLHGVAVAAPLQRRLPDVRIVKAYNTLPTAVLAQEQHRNPRYVLPLSGDDSEARLRVAALIRDGGFEPLDLGDLSHAVHQEPGGVLYARPLTLPEAEAALASARGARP